MISVNTAGEEEPRGTGGLLFKLHRPPVREAGVLLSTPLGTGRPGVSIAEAESASRETGRALTSGANPWEQSGR